MSEVRRSPWGEDPVPPSSKQDLPQGLPTRILFMFLLGLVPAVLVLLFLNAIDFAVDPRPSAQIIASDPSLASQMTTNIEMTRALITSAVAAIFELGILFSFLTVLSTSRRGRGLFVVGLIALVGLLLASIVGIGIGQLVPLSRPGERLILPALILVFSGILALFSPGMQLWRVNVPDNQVWMILDRNDHLVSYMGPGIRMIRPIEGFAKYEEGGALIIEIDDESFVSHDNFPYRVRVHTVCLYNPLNADPSMWVALRGMKREVMENDLRTEIEFMIRHRISNYVREYLQQRMKLDEVLNTLAMDIKEAVEQRKHMGVRLAPLNSINVILDPPDVVLSSRQRRMSVEALASGEPVSGSNGLRELLQLASLDGDLKLDIGADGRLSFSLNPGDNIEIGDKLEKAIMGAVRVLGSVAGQQQADRPASQQLTSGLSSSHTAATTPLSKDTQGQHVDRSPKGSEEAPAIHIAPEPPEASQSEQQTDDNVIETDIDDKGVFFPRNPIMPDPNNRD